MRYYALAFVLLIGVASAGLQTLLPGGNPRAAGIEAEVQPTPAPLGSPVLPVQATPPPVPITTPAPAATATSTPATPPTATLSPATRSVPAATPTSAPTAASTSVPTATSTPAPEPTAAPPLATLPAEADAAVFAGAGDIAACSGSGPEATAKLLEQIGGTVFTVGDNALPSGTTAEFANCYDPSWGRFKERTRPAAGNHEYQTRGASGYFAYFGAAAGEPGKGYYSFDLGAWHIVVLNTQCSDVGGCGSTSPQVQWLRADLAANPTRCSLAIGHVPRFSSGLHGSAPEIQPIWQALYDAGAELIIAGHDHDYERFAPQDPAGRADPDRGIRQFIVGTGGASHYPLGPRIANSEVSNGSTFGVLKLTLRSTGYDWEFVPVAGSSFTDSGSASCH